MYTIYFAMDDPLFSYQTIKMSDDEFWQHMRQLDEISLSSAAEMGGFSVKIQTGKGKVINVPYVRFARTMPEKAS